MKIAVLVKIIPKTIKFDSREKRIIRSNDAVINPNDLVSLGFATKLKRKIGGLVYAFSMGPEFYAETLSKVFDYGVDRAILLSDKSFSNSDVFATANVLSTAIKTFMSDFDFVFTSDYSLDGFTGLLPGEVSKSLEIPILSSVIDFYKNENSVLAVRENGNYLEEFEIKDKVLISFSSKLNHFCLPNLFDAFYSDKKVKIYDNSFLKIDENLLGLNGSKTKVIEVFERKRNENANKLITENGEQFIIEEIKNGG